MDELTEVFSALMTVEYRVIGCKRVTGGCISEAYKVLVEDSAGKQLRWFAKANQPSFLSNFNAEADGLERLGATGSIRVPRPACVGQVAGRVWLIMEWIDQSPQHDSFFRDLGTRLAELHQCTSGRRIGLEQDNFLGAATQINQATGRWTDFFAENRLGFQLRWGVDQRLVDGSLRQACERIIGRLDQLLEGRAEDTSLLHGDLWSGNYLCDDTGQPVILDPAVYYGCREAEFGMLRLFGACPPPFYESYQDCFPMKAGWQRRVKVYVLYHLLNHLNLFGSGYHSECQRMAEQILRS